MRYRTDIVISKKKVRRCRKKTRGEMESDTGQTRRRKREMITIQFI